MSYTYQSPTSAYRVSLSSTSHQDHQTMSYHQSSKSSNTLATDLAHYFSPKKRLDSLFVVHASFSILVGVLGFLFPSSANVFFSTETKREFAVARAIIRPYCSLILAQGLMIWRARKINDGEIKRAFVQAYFVCFLLSTLALINDHMGDYGVVSGKLMGIIKIAAMIGLTAGYGWFVFFQPPAVFSGLGHYRSS